MAEQADVEIVLRLSELQAFLAQTREAQTAVHGIGTSAEEGAVQATAAAEKTTGVVGRIRQMANTAVTSLHRMGSKATETGGWMNKLHATASKPIIGGGMMGQLGAMAAGYVGISGIKDAIENTSKLALSAKSLHAITGMSSQDAADYSAITQAYGGNTKQFALAMKSISGQVGSFQAGMKSGTDTFGQLGIGLKTVQANSGDMSKMLGVVVDHFNQMPAGAAKTTLATKLFGRSWQTLMPLFSQGSKGMEEQRKQAEAMGITLGGNATKNAMKLHEAQVSLKLATMGLQVQFAQHLAPVLLQLFGILMKVAGVVLRQMGPAFKMLGNIVNDVTAFFRKHQTVLKAVEIVVGLLIAQWVYGKAVILAARAAQLALNLVMNLGRIALFAYRAIVLAVRAAMLIWQGVIWLVNAALDANPIAIVILAIIALIAIVVLVITHFKQVKAAIIDAWNAIQKAFQVAINWIIGFVKKNWPLLIGIFGGPIGIIIGIFIRFHGQIIGIFQGIWSFVKTIPGKIAGAFAHVGQAIISPFKTAFDWVKSHVPHLHMHHLGPVSVPLPFATGGTMPHTGMALVGEAGPELLHLPRGAQITPLNRTNNFTTVNQNNPGGVPPIVVSVQVDRKEIARAVHRANADVKARQ